MKAVLLVIDLQNDFVTDPRLKPTADNFLTRVAQLLGKSRNLGIPVVHLHYITEPDGRGYLRHHREKGRKRCERGSPGAEPHPVAVPMEDEPVFAKHAYSAFSSSEFVEHLKRINTDTLILCGLHSHVCIRETALDALEKGYRVLIAEDAVASYDSLHAQVTKSFLSEHSVTYRDNGSIFNSLNSPIKPSPISPPKEFVYPSACINGHWIKDIYGPSVEMRNPSHWDEVLGYVASPTPESIELAVSTAHQAQAEWETNPLTDRLAIVESWGNILEKHFQQFLPIMIEEVGKPIDACKTEWKLLQSSLKVIGETFKKEAFERFCQETDDQLAMARRLPQGVVVIITPWNNPVFLPTSKIAAAIATGNAVVWKPALQCAKTSIALQNSLLETGIPSGLVNLVFGGAEVAQRLIQFPGVNAVTLTGSVDTGREVAAQCGSLLKPLQAELGGNNAAIVTQNCNLPEVAQLIALSAFGFAGQACTATRRVIVETAIEEEFVDLLKQATQSLVVGHPQEGGVIVGPVISKSHQQQIENCIASIGEKADVFEADRPEHLSPDGCWVPPRIIQGLDVSDPLVQEESFAPVLIIQTAKDIDHALKLCNSVPHGLISSIFCDDDAIIQKFRDNAECGILQINLPTRNLHMESPFGGWKDSGLGPPEHGTWDLDFYTRWQAVNKLKEMD